LDLFAWFKEGQSAFGKSILVPHFDVKRQPQGLPEPGH
jgi:hypothetical protein